MNTSPVVTRFAPSPTGYLHIGGARTALFNWLFAKANGGRFLLRIEDTDRARSTPEATEAIFEGMRWLGLNWDGDAISQFERAPRHAEVAHAMLAAGTAYKCFSTQDEIAAFREAAKAEGRSTLFRSPWREADPADHPDAPFVVRLKAPQSGKTTIADQVQGDVTWGNDTLDDLVLLRSDGTPTYMLAVVVDDHDMGVTHVIRGDDHLTNAARQALIYQANGWKLPVFAHIPLIHGPDGAKLSKRHGALGVEAYRDMGYPAEAMRNYLARLGWSHGDDEVFTTAQAVEWFTLDGIGKSPARFDFAKLENISGQHLRMMSPETVAAQLTEFAASQQKPLPDGVKGQRLNAALPLLKERAKTFLELIDSAYFCTADRPLKMDQKAAQQLQNVSHGMLNALTQQMQNVTWTATDLEAFLRDHAAATEQKLGKVMQPLRAALTGSTTSPSVFEILVILGQEESLARLNDALSLTAQDD
ncbi:glutamyl-tRNA synthetase [Rubricella aquisinus]|uniref:Glutamate--tRNA ligase n=1 Tax=Rubricella aquisinus TaxID=2028108 RepID=A0A840WYH7_9RHOB|nr:glutamate--tRNA ligase [Rubricella aquisinus]MBB5514726.1 glutamyl-tRNA synthetase [Rubricella aquisinus]